MLVSLPSPVPAAAQTTTSREETECDEPAPPPVPDEASPAAGPSSDSSAPADAASGRTAVFYETTTVTARPVSSASGAVTVLDREELEAAAARSGSDALRPVPGLHLVETGGRAGVTHAWIRGADPNFTLVLLDGVPLNDSTDLQGGAFNFEELPAGLVERVEVVRGPQTAFYGTSGLSGVVQLFTPRAAGGSWRAASGVEAGDAELRRGFARAAFPAGGAGWSAGLSYDEERGRIAAERFEQLDAWGGADLALSPGAEIGLTARFAGGEQDDYPESSGGPVYGTGELRHTRHDDLAVGVRLSLGEAGGRRHLLSAGLARRSQHRTSPAIFPLVPESEERTVFTRLRLAWQAPVRRGERTQVDVGASGDGEWGENASVLRLPPALGGDVPGDYDETRWSGGVFGAVGHRLGPVRLEAVLRADAASGDSPRLHPHLGAVWSPGSGDTRLRVSAGQASKLPSFFALHSPPALGGNPDLRPERTTGGEAGVEHRIRAARLDLGAAFFLHEYRDLVDFDFDLFAHVNRARVRTRGVELTMRWRPHDSVWVEAEATYLDARDLSGEPLLYEPRWLGGGRVTWRPDDRLSLRFDLRAVSRYLDRQIPVPEQGGVAGRALVGFAGSWRVHGRWSLRARLDNLADRDHETLVGFPGAGRSFRAGLGWER